MTTTGRRPRRVSRSHRRQGITSTSDREVENIEAGFLVEGEVCISLRQKLKTMAKHLERAALIADLIDVVAKISDFI